MPEPIDRWHYKNPEKEQAKRTAKGLPPLELCNCRGAKERGLPTPEHGCDRRWLAHWRDADGKQRFRKILTKGDGVEPGGIQYARAYMNSQRAAVQEGRDPFPYRRRTARGVPTIAEYVETFLEQHEGRAGTVETYAYRLRPHVVPVFGYRALDDVKRAEWREFLVGLRSKVSHTTRDGIRRSISAMYGVAVEDEVVDANPVAGLRLPKGDAKEVRLAWRHVVALAADIDPRYELTVWYGSLQALRSMEAAGVRRADMEQVRGRQMVEEQRRRGQAAPLKTDASRAVLPVGDFLLGKYDAHVSWLDVARAEAETRRRRRGTRPVPEQYAGLVTLTRYWTPLRENALCRAFTEAKTKARARGVDVPEGATFRDLRHFADAVLVASGVEPCKVQARMRHARLAETLDTYGYLLWEVDWENAPASFTELYGIPEAEAPNLPDAAKVPQAQRGLGAAGRSSTTVGEHR